MEVSLADIVPHLTERGRVELDLAIAKHITKVQGDVIATLTAAVEEKQPCGCQDAPT